jgi:hypothetical protein
LRWFLILEGYRVTFEHLPGKKQKNVASVADALSCLDIDALKIQEKRKRINTSLRIRKQQHQ